MAAQQPLEEDVKAEFDVELEDFEAEPEFHISHILIEDKSAAAKIAELQKKLDASESFSELAKTYSDDMSSKGNGGSLGLMVSEGYEQSFVDAVIALEEGQVSSAVETDSGMHFIKLDKKSVPVAPTFETRKAIITKRLQRDMAAEAFALASVQVDELVFGMDNLNSAAEELGLKVKTSDLFPRYGGVGIAANQQVAEAAYAEDVLVEGQNSKLVEIEPEHAVVLRLKERQEEHIRPLEQVKIQIQNQLKSKQIAVQLQEKARQIIAKLNGGVSPSVVAKDLSYEFKEHEAIERTSLDADRSILREAFGMARPASEGAEVVDSFSLPAGDMVIVGLRSVEDGSADSLEKQQVEAMQAQLERQIGMDEMSAYETGVYQSAQVSM